MAFIELPILGIDISKAKFDVALLVYGKVKKSRVFENNLVGFKALSLWLVKQDITHLQACMEATGTYGDELATYLYDQGFEVSVVNPAQIKSFSGAQLNRAKTDKADAKLIAPGVRLRTHHRQRQGSSEEARYHLPGGHRQQLRDLAQLR